MEKDFCEITLTLKLNRARAVIRGQRSKEMKQQKTKTRRVKIAISKVYLDEVLQWYETRDFVELVGRKGGDTLTYRVYDNGTITER